MCVYNGERYLREAIESILRQTFTDFEFLIIDDGSTDASRSIVLSYDDPRIRLVVNETNIGLTKSLNKGLDLARGEYVARMDADDVSMPERLGRQVDFMDDNPGVWLLGSCSEFIDSTGTTCRRNSSRLTREELYYRLNFGNVFPHSSVMFRRREVMTIGGYDESFRRSQDYELWSRISSFGPVDMLKAVLIKWREADGNISSASRGSQRNDALRVFERNLRKLFPEGFCEKMKGLRVFHDISLLGWDAVRLSFRDVVALMEFNDVLIDTAPTFISRPDLRRVSRRTTLAILKKTALDVFPVARKMRNFLRGRIGRQS